MAATLIVAIYSLPYLRQTANRNNDNISKIGEMNGTYHYL